MTLGTNSNNNDDTTRQDIKKIIVLMFKQNPFAYQKKYYNALHFIFNQTNWRMRSHTKSLSNP